jgi:hypothetical protein
MRHELRDELRDTGNGDFRVVQQNEDECLINDRFWDTQTLAPHQAHSHKLDASYTFGITY